MTAARMQYAGIDISAGQYIADELGKELQVENMSFDYLLTSLAKGDFDIVNGSHRGHARASPVR